MADGLHCPSSQPDQPDSMVIGVIAANEENGARATMLPRAVPIHLIAHLVPDGVPIISVSRRPIFESHGGRS